jgi:hypothetical protein
MELQLDGITMKKLALEWIPPEDVKKVRAVGTLQVKFIKEQQDTKKFCLLVNLKQECRALEGNLEGYQVDVLVNCQFTSAIHVDSEETGKAAIRTALPIIYGTLRGMLASVTGCFEVGLLLPTTDVNALVNDAPEFVAGKED